LESFQRKNGSPIDEEDIIWHKNNPPTDREAFTWNLTQRTASPGERCVAVRLNLTLQQQCALELYSGFIDALASKIQALGGETSSISYHIEKKPRWENQVLNNISKIFLDEGLVDDIRVVNAIIIPPFARRRLLPTREGKVNFKKREKREGGTDEIAPNNPDRDDTESD
jgi:hypothetical protein